MDSSTERARMVRAQLASRGIRDQKVLAAMGRIRREEFVPGHQRDFAYDDSPLPIGCDQTISQPYIVALMTEALELAGGEHVLEIGTGSGYAAAVLAEIAGSVVTVERFEALANDARAVLERLGYTNITVVHGDGTLGHQAEAPYDGIVVTAGGPDAPRALLEQLKPGGRLVMPLGSRHSVQQLVRITRAADDRYDREVLCDVRFVPLVGEQGWSHG